MADVITRFKLETTQYDSKLRDASKQLSEITKTAALAGNEFGKFTQKNVEAARAFGQIATSATNSKDKVKELVGAFNDVAKQYNVLTKEQQQSDFGKALAESMTTLKGRISEAKAEMNSTGGIMEQLAQKFTINIDAVKLFNVGLQAAEGALKVAKDAFFASEANVDEWGRTIQAAQSVYEGFLISINNGDISGFINNIDDIVKAARAAYNELDKLNTMRTIQSPGFAKQEAENARMRTMLMTGKWISAADGRVSPLGLKDGDKLSAEMMRVIERQLQGGMNKIVSLTKNEIGQTGKAIDAYYNSLAKQNGMSLKEFRSGTSSWESFSEKMAGYEAYKRWDAQARTEFAKQGGRGYVDFDKNNPYADFRKWGNFRVDKMGENSYNDLVNLIKQQQSQQSQLYSTMGQAYRTMNRVNGETVRSIMGGGGSGGGSGHGGAGATEITYAADSITAMEKEVGELTKLWKDAGAAVRDKYAAQLAEAKLRLDEINGKSKKIIFDSEQAAKQVGFSQGKNAAQTSGLGSIDSFKNFKVEGLSPEALEAANKWMKDMEEGGNKVQKSWKNAASAIGLVGSAMASVKDPAAQIASTVAMAIANIAMAYSETLAKDKTNKSNIWYFIATAAAAMVSMTTTIASIHSATGYAQGGEIKGNSYSGDNIAGLVDGKQLVGLNAGEIVLNQAQQANVAHGLQGAGGNLHLEGILQGENILIAANRTAKRKGYGEMMFWQGG